MNKLYQQLAFINELEKLKTVKRGNLTLDDFRFENSAEHSWQAAMCALVFREYFPQALNMGKVLELLLVHELGEMRAGDTSVFDEVGKADSFERELAAMKVSVSKLPKEQAQEMADLWLEFEKGSSAEARYSRVIDALIPLINHVKVAEENYNPASLTKTQVLAKKKFIKDQAPALWPLVQELIHQSVTKGLYLDK
ncbi:HD domain-containing protein [Streptococcus oricebi]|uniref:Phosphohydrolase n=1 Tax=Streptococcus oricebi TaxID=1547447 RepID=A0ABS5B0R5_9STRE|nr:HD domain-containing protein [Streptococcus oricebi]MBP2622422.1 phosphohydrolase [Streptococcus oricebi]